MVTPGALDELPDEGTEAHPVQPGEIIAGKYRVERVLGEGGMGVVVAATHLVLGELVAVKLLRADVTVDREEAMARFSREARAAAKMRGEHVARVFDVGTLDDGTSYIVLEYLEGQDLDAWLGDSGKLPLEVAVGYMLEACEALAEAHAAGIVHRDIKPSNLFLAARPDGTASLKVLDFGISRTREIVPDSAVGPLTDAKSSLTIGALGTPPYVAPEQIMDSTAVDARADVWALGATLYELTTGGPPFDGPSMYAMCTSILRDTPSAPSTRMADLPKGFDDVVLRCLAKHPGDRYQDVAELAIALVPFGPEDAARIAENVVRMRARGRSADAGREPVRATLSSMPERASKRAHRAASKSDPTTSTPTPSDIVRARIGDSTPPVESYDHPSSRAIVERRGRVRRVALGVLFVTAALGAAIGGVALGRRVEHAPVSSIAVARVSAVAQNAAAWAAATAAHAAPAQPGGRHVEVPAAAAASAKDGRPSSSAAAGETPEDRGRIGRPKRGRSTEDDLFNDRK